MVRKENLRRWFPFPRDGGLPGHETQAAAFLRWSLKRRAPTTKTLHFYVRSTMDWVLVCPEHPAGRRWGPDGRRRVLLGGYSSLLDLSMVQIRALVDLVLRCPDAHKNAAEAIFYDADTWALSMTNRRKVIHRVALP